jgi:predicted PhzF superfamily epimerase YddE/YHI9
MTIHICTIDALTDRPFTGNPAAVCLLNEPKEDRWLQSVAAEMNLSETAFLWPEGDRFRLRWFTPAIEVDLCGHATLASAHFLWQGGHLAPDQPARFQTRSGVLTAARRGERIELDFPALATTRCEPPPGLLEALGAEPQFVGKSRFDYLVEFDQEAAVRSLQPSFRQLARLGVRGVIVTARGSPPYDFISRFFAPGAGIDEDPVTGSAHCALGPYWQSRLGTSAFHAYQASKRGGEVRVTVKGDRVLLAGQAVTVLRGELLA